jgi:hypothetical protein
MSRTTRFLLSLVLCAGGMALLSCSNTPPRTRFIQEEKFADLYARILVVQEEGRLRGTDSLALVGRTDSLCGAHGLTRDGVQTELGYYRGDLPLWREFIEKVIRNLEQLQREEQAARR